MQRRLYLASLMLVCALLAGGCGLFKSAVPGGPGDAPGQEQQEQQGQESAPQATGEEDQPVEATWAIEIDDTQQVADEMGLLWNYTLALYASKPGGADATGEYEGEAVLKIEPDFDSAKALAAREGTELLSMLFRYQAECAQLSFEIVPFSEGEYAARMKAANPDDPLTQFDPGASTDFFAVVSATFDASQDSIVMTINDDGEIKTGSTPGRAASVTVPVEITFNGANAYCFIYNTPHTLDKAFKGTASGDVLP